ASDEQEVPIGQHSAPINCRLVQVPTRQDYLSPAVDCRHGRQVAGYDVTATALNQVIESVVIAARLSTPNFGDQLIPRRERGEAIQLGHNLTTELLLKNEGQHDGARNAQDEGRSQKHPDMQQGEAKQRGSEEGTKIHRLCS